MRIKIWIKIIPEPVKYQQRGTFVNQYRAPSSILTAAQPFYQRERVCESESERYRERQTWSS